MAASELRACVFAHKCARSPQTSVIKIGSISDQHRWVGALQRLEEKNRRNRSRFEISADILGAAREGARKTHIMYRANLSFNMLCRYLDLLALNGLLSVDISMDELYRTTEKGLIYLEAFDAYKRSECIYADKARSLGVMLSCSRSIDWSRGKLLPVESSNPTDRFWSAAGRS